MTTFRVLVVDDEPLAREVAVNILRRDSEVDRVAECADGLRTREVIADTRPDIVFLDIEMPGLNGVQLAEDLPGGAPVVVFMTAFSQHAVRAFDLAATDYVLKPFSDERFLDALTRAKRRVRERRLGELAGQMASVAAELQPESAGPSPDGPFLRRLSLKQGDRTFVLRTEEIVWIEAQDYCVMIHSSRGRHLVRGSLTTLEGQLDPNMFVRTHRMAIVNLHHVRETHDRDGLPLVLSDNSQVGVSRSRKAHVESLLSPRLRCSTRGLKRPRSAVFGDLQRAAASWLRSAGRAPHCKRVEADDRTRDDRQHSGGIMRRVIWSSVIWTVVAVVVTGGFSAARQRPLPQPSAGVMPQYDANRNLMLPADYRQWVLAGSSLGLSYAEGGAQGVGMQMFSTTLIEPTAYRHFVETGEFRDGTMLVLLLQGIGTNALPARRGQFATDAHGIEMAVKDTSRVPEGWAYYNFGGSMMGGLRSSAAPSPKASCYNCHIEHAARDNVFMQFYQMLRDVDPRARK